MNIINLMLLIVSLISLFILMNYNIFYKNIKKKTEPTINIKNRIYTSSYFNSFSHNENVSEYDILMIIFGPFCYLFLEQIKIKRTIYLLKSNIIDIKLFTIMVYNYSELRQNLPTKELIILNRLLKIENLKNKK